MASSGGGHSRFSSLTSLSFVSLGSSALTFQVSSMGSLASSQACSNQSLKVASPKSSKASLTPTVPEDKAEDGVKTAHDSDPKEELPVKVCEP